MFSGASALRSREVAKRASHLCNYRRCVSFGGVLLEHVSDTQMDVFAAKRKAGNAGGRQVLDEGLCVVSPP